MYDNTVSVPFAIGLILLAVSLFFLGKKNSEKEEKKISIKWLLFVSIAFVSNGICSILQTHQQRKCAGNYKSEFMMVAMAIVFLFCLITIMINFKRNKEVLSINVKKGWWIAVLYALCNALLNLSVMLSVGKISPGIVFPVICGGGLILALILSEIVFKEKLSSFQYVGFVLGVVSIVLLNI
ncbi:MAG: EamA family transporter [Candidatus Borkfalkiaceae bacterium]|nr:EamA family transporter [Clostridia bacterium]MDY6223743.1 EamA family transporter [Christensenellaceae bacterium]